MTERSSGGMTENGWSRDSALQLMRAELLEWILLAAASHSLNRSYYALATVCRSFHRILSRDFIKLGILRSHQHNFVPFLTACAGAPNLERLLITFLTGTNLDRRNAAVQSALLDLSVKRGFLVLARLLLTNGADPNQRHLWDGIEDPDQSSAVWRAVEKDDVAMLRLLVDFGAVCPFNEFENAHLFAQSDEAHRLLLDDNFGPDDVLDAAIREIEPESVRLALAMGATPALDDVLALLGRWLKQEVPGWDAVERVVECVQHFVDAGMDAEEILATMGDGKNTSARPWEALRDFLVERLSR
ncbi:hypothetical protein DFJ73DRAFT_832570 [Zopfochytrium polystomum]|nr:hypothetical protein DFJ73DRAFT_832570 [Zopfochytrium polystomum]